MKYISIKKRRLFVAIKISESLQKKILKWQGKFLKRHPTFANPPSHKAMDGQRATADKVRWQSGKNLHITIIPPWYDKEFKSVVTGLRKIACCVRPFKIRFSYITYRPDSKRPRLIWAEGEAPKELLDFKKLLEGALDKKTDLRPFLLHLTLARFRPDDFSQFKIKKLDEKVFWQDEVFSIVLMESHLSPHGADYEVLKEFKF